MWLNKKIVIISIIYSQKLYFFNIIMDNYEINILRRGGNWKKVKPDDLIIDEIK